MYNALDYKWANTLFGCLAVLMIPIPFVRALLAVIDQNIDEFSFRFYFSMGLLFDNEASSPEVSLRHNKQSRRGYIHYFRTLRGS